MTEQELQAIEQRAAAATAGPWGLRLNEHDDWGMVRAADGLPVMSACMTARIPESFRAMPWGSECQAGPPEIAANGEFVSHAREDVPALLAEVRRLQAALNVKEGNYSVKVSHKFDTEAYLRLAKAATGPTPEADHA